LNQTRRPGPAAAERRGRRPPRRGRRARQPRPVLQDLGDLEGVRAQLERALGIGEVALGPDHPDVAAIRDNLGSLIQALQEPPPEDPASAR
jgi:hypothetical protein